MTNTEDRFWSKVDKRGPDECWEWTATKTRKGYGQFNYEGRTQRAHRVAYMIAIGPIPRESLDHICRNRGCVNPSHLEPVSSRENTLRGEGVAALHAKKSCCPKGHELTDGNLRASEVSRGKRACLRCDQDRVRVRNDLIHRARSLLGMTWQTYRTEYGSGRATAIAVVLKEITRPIQRAVNR